MRVTVSLSLRLLCAAATSLALGGCEDAARSVSLRDPAASDQATLATASAAQCPTQADFIVSDEQSLRAAVEAASPGNVIAVAGTIQTTETLVFKVDNVTLTCGKPGSGLVARFEGEDPGRFAFLLFVWARNVTVANLVLDGSGALGGPYGAFRDGMETFAEAPRFTNNRVTCGPLQCALFIGTPGALVLDNYFQATGIETGVHLELRSGADGPVPIGDIDDSRVERNTIISTGPSPDDAPLFGGIRAQGGRNVRIANNTVVGPWTTSLSISDLSESVIQGNRFEGAKLFGIGLLPPPYEDPSLLVTTGTVFKDNVVTGAGNAGLFLELACYNNFLGNSLQGGTPGWRGAVFRPTTGANDFVGNPNVVIDRGSFDCDGDGIVDPNRIRAPGLT
jgi:hypothetical protein